MSDNGSTSPGDTCIDGGPTIDPATTPKLVISGDTGSTNGIGDPSVAYPYMSYTALQATSLFTRIAKTHDGVSFTYIADANTYRDTSVTTTDTTVCGSDTCGGRLVHETSSLLRDDGDPDPTRRYKLFDYSYLIVPAASPAPQHAWGYIGLYTAASPETGWSGGVKAIGWTSTANALSRDGALTVASDIAALDDCLAFTEPAAMMDGNTLYLALGCALAQSIRVVLMRSDDHAATFSYVGTLLDTAYGAQPSAFFQANDATYLIVSALGTTPAVANAPEGYIACRTLAVANLTTATVNTSPVRELVAPGGAFTGACAFDSTLGYLVFEVVASSATVDQIFRPGITCP